MPLNPRWSRYACAGANLAMLKYGGFPSADTEKGGLQGGPDQPVLA